jgi:UDP-glucuronate 4-epimerase
MNTVLITGCAGFIGSCLSEKLLMMGYEVIGIDNFCDSYDPLLKRENICFAIRCSNYKLYKGDILDTELLEQIFEENSIDTVIHLAALAGVRRSIECPLDYVDVDIKGTVGLLELCRKYKVSKFVFASSSSVYGSNKPPFSEEMPLEAQLSPYAASKMSGELFCRTYNSLYGIPTVCLRFFTVYGPRQRPDMAIRLFTEAAMENRSISVYGDGSSARDYTYIDDIVDGIIASASLDCNFEIINLGNSRPINILDVISLIEKYSERKVEIKYLPVQAGDVDITCADISKAEKLLGYSPKVDLETGIKKFVKWYKDCLERI